jgi:hypothetical protein
MNDRTQPEDQRPQVWRASEMASNPPPVDCGPWALDADLLVLRIAGDGYSYRVDLRECLTSAQVLDRVLQISRKRWATDAVLGGLVRALNWALDPQTHLCPFGHSKTITAPKVRRIVNERKGHALRSGGAV